MVKLLLECNADPSLQNTQGKTALMEAQKKGKKEVVTMIQQHHLKFQQEQARRALQEQRRLEDEKVRRRQEEEERRRKLEEAKRTEEENKKKDEENQRKEEEARKIKEVEDAKKRQERERAGKIESVKNFVEQICFQPLRDIVSLRSAQAPASAQTPQTVLLRNLRMLGEFVVEWDRQREGYTYWKSENFVLLTQQVREAENEYAAALRRIAGLATEALTKDVTDDRDAKRQTLIARLELLQIAMGTVKSSEEIKKYYSERAQELGALVAAVGGEDDDVAVADDDETLKEVVAKSILLFLTWKSVSEKEATAVRAATRHALEEYTNAHVAVSDIMKRFADTIAVSIPPPIEETNLADEVARLFCSVSDWVEMESQLHISQYDRMDWTAVKAAVSAIQSAINREPEQYARFLERVKNDAVALSKLKEVQEKMESYVPTDLLESVRAINAEIIKEKRKLRLQFGDLQGLIDEVKAGLSQPDEVVAKQTNVDAIRALVIAKILEKEQKAAELIAFATEHAPEILVKNKDLLGEIASFPPGVLKMDRNLSMYDIVKPLHQPHPWHKVYLARFDTKQCVLKEFVSVNEDMHRDVFLRESRSLLRLDHPHIIKIEGIFYNDKDAFIQMPYYAGGDLSSWMNPPHSDAEVQQVMMGIVMAVAHLHANQKLHCDIKLDNILINDKGVPALADFDVSVDQHTRAAAPLRKQTTLVAGTVGYMAPEVVLGQKCTRESDIFSLGACILFLSFISDAIRYENTLDKQGNVAMPLRLPRHSNKDLLSLLQAVLQEDPAKRLTAASMLSHPYFAPTRDTVAREMPRPPVAWGLRSVVNECEHSYHEVDVTNELRGAFQTLVDATMKKDLLGLVDGADLYKRKGAYSTLRIMRVMRIENATVWRRYFQFRAALQAKTEFAPVGAVASMTTLGTDVEDLAETVNEKYLFHGTTEALHENIKRDGFCDRQGQGRIVNHKLFYGKQGVGTYFAENSSKADECTGGAGKEKALRYMFLARVVLGNFFATDKENPDVNEPPNGCHSIVFDNKEEQYREFIVYNPEAQCYPEYLIEYRQEQQLQ